MLCSADTALHLSQEPLQLRARRPSHSEHFAAPSADSHKWQEKKPAEAAPVDFGDVLGFVAPLGATPAAMKRSVSQLRPEPVFDIVVACPPPTRTGRSQGTNKPPASTHRGHSREPLGRPEADLREEQLSVRKENGWTTGEHYISNRLVQSRFAALRGMNCEVCRSHDCCDGV